VTVVIVGGGPAGLSAAAELGRLGLRDIVVIEREREAGGIPRHAQHQGFGIRDQRRLLSGPAYAHRLRAAALEAGADLREETMVTSFRAGRLELSSAAGRSELAPEAVILAMGCRERPRSARLVPGSRPQGVMTTSTLQQLVYMKGARPGGRALIVGAEHVSYSAIATLAHGGARAVGMVTELGRHQSLAPFALGGRLRHRVPLWTRTAVRAIHGRPRVEAVELTDLDSGRVRRVACELVVFSADWIPDNELAVMAGLELDPGTRGPAVDAALRSSRPGVFGAGNMLHGAETADVAALSGRHAARSVARWLVHRAEPAPGIRVPIRLAEPLAWIAPNVIAPDAGDPLRERFVLRSREFVRRPHVSVVQDGRELWSGRLSSLVPGRSTGRLPHGWTAAVDPAGDPVEITARA